MHFRYMRIPLANNEESVLSKSFFDSCKLIKNDYNSCYKNVYNKNNLV